MQSFVFSSMNKASRDKVESKIPFYGPLASALGYIIHIGNQRMTQINREFNAYRGLRMKQ